MKKHLSFLLLLLGNIAFAQTNVVVTNATADAIMAGSYSVATYSSTSLMSAPSLVSVDINASISPDSLKAYVRRLAGFKNRNTNSLFTTSTTTGLSATNAWVESKFNQFSR